MGDTRTLKRRPRRWRLLAVTVAFGLVAAACGGNNDTDEAEPGQLSGAETIEPDIDAEDEEVQTGGTIIYGLEAETNNWLPGIYAGNNSGPNIATAVYDSIAARGADGVVHPYLALSIEPNDDLTEWTITLRPGITMHDGTELNAELMKTIFDNYLTVDTATTAGSLSGVTELRVDDELTYTYVLNDTNSAFPDLLIGPVGYPFSVEACEARGGRDGDCGEHPVGAGAFIFDSWSRDDKLRLVRNPNYWRTDANGIQLPYLDELIFRPIPDEDSRLQSVIAGNIHVGQTLRQSIVRQGREQAGVVTYEAIGNNGGANIINTARPPVDDVRVRRGLISALDQDATIEVLGGTGITPRQTQYFSSDSPWFSQRVAEAYLDYDTERAAEYFDDYINDPDRSDGKAVGEPIIIEFSCPPDPSLIDIAQAYQGFWQAAGLEVHLTTFDQATHIQNGLNSDYMVQCWRLGGQGDPYPILRGAFENPDEPLNVSNYTSENIQANLEILRTSADFSERYVAVESIMMELAEKAVVSWTGSTATSVYALPSVRNLTGWTIPDQDGMPTIPGTGVLGAISRWSEVWLKQ